MKQNPPITYIDHLPELEQLDNGLSLEQNNKVNNKIRQPFVPSVHSGMNINNKDSSNNSKMQARHQNVINTRQESNNFNNVNIDNNSYQKEMHNMIKESQVDSNVVEEHFKPFNMPFGSPSCLDVAEHISKCPICSKFYNTDKTIYIIAIITLVIICILLLKKVLDV
jgi:hypothetical protein